VSDIHAEHLLNIRDIPFKVEGDILLMLGDIVDTPKLLQEFLSVLKPTVPVVYILGNHEYFFMDIDTGMKSYEIVASRYTTAKVTILSMPLFPYIFSTETGERVRILGGTMWTDYAKGTKTKVCSQSMWEISSGNMMGNHSPDKIIDEHTKFKSRLVTELKYPFAGKTIVATHHSPSVDLCDVQYLGSPISSAFHADMRDIILEYSPYAWVYGHVHSPRDQMIGSTRCIANPYGYRGTSGVKNFNPSFMLEV